MIALSDKETGEALGTITEAQLQFLKDHLEEESLTDNDYYINMATLDMLAERGAEPDLLKMLHLGLKGRDGMEIRWSQ